MTKVLVITTDKQVYDKEVTTLAEQQEIVGGLIEPIDLPQIGATLWVNEMFLFTDLEFNSIATDVCGLGGRSDLMLPSPLNSTTTSCPGLGTA